MSTQPKLNRALPPRDDGSCNCGATVLSTDSEPCIFCGGYTKGQIFDNCNVCGIKLRTEDEFSMGMCERCAAE